MKKKFGFVMVFLGWYNSGFPLPTIGANKE